MYTFMSSVMADFCSAPNPPVYSDGAGVVGWKIKKG